MRNSLCLIAEMLSTFLLVTMQYHGMEINSEKKKKKMKKSDYKVFFSMGFLMYDWPFCFKSQVLRTTQWAVVFQKNTKNKQQEYHVSITFHSSHSLMSSHQVTHCEITAKWWTDKREQWHALKWQEPKWVRWGGTAPWCPTQTPRHWRAEVKHFIFSKCTPLKLICVFSVIVSLL